MYQFADEDFAPLAEGRFTTYERVQLRDLVVIKSNGRREEFDRAKLERSIRIALQKRPVEHERMDQMILDCAQIGKLGRNRYSLQSNW